MALIRLELDKFKIDRPKERWELYFVIVTEHPEDKDKLIIRTTPNPPIRLKQNQDNEYSFKPEGEGTDGLLLLEREIPKDDSIRVRTYLMHSRKKIRNSGQLMDEMKDVVGGDAVKVASGLLGVTAPWLVLANAGYHVVEHIFSKMKDRDFGFISLDEEFENEFTLGKELPRANNFSTGQAKLWWSWKVK